MGTNLERRAPGILTAFAVCGLLFSLLTLGVLVVAAISYFDMDEYRPPVDSRIGWAFVLSAILGLFLFQGAFRILCDRRSGIILIRTWACLSLAYDTAITGYFGFWLPSLLGLPFAGLFLTVTFQPEVRDFFRSDPSRKPKFAETWSHKAF